MPSAQGTVRLTLACTATVAATYGLGRYAFALFIPNIRLDFALSTADAGFLASASFALYLLATLVAPYLSAAGGARLPVIAGGLSASAGMAVISFSSDLWTLAAGAILAGLSPGLSFTAMPDAIRLVIAEDARRGRALAVLNAGTSVGIALSGPLAILAGVQWRTAWQLFAAITLACTIWIARVLPAEPPGPYRRFAGPALSGAARTRPAYFPPGSIRLFSTAFLVAVTTSVYWTFAVDLIAASGSYPIHFGGLFFLVVGLSDITGGFGGELVTRFGLRRVLVATVVSLVGAIHLLPLSIDAWPYGVGIFASAALFGTAFFVMTSVLIIHSTRVFSAQPSRGLGTALFLVGIGQIAGPAISGLAASRWGLPPVFHIAGVAVLAIALLGPRENQ